MADDIENGAQDSVEGRAPSGAGRRQQAGKQTPMRPEGPHARADLTDTDKTPGTGSLPDPSKHEADIGPD